MARLKKYYQTELRDELKNKLGLKNIFEVPKITKIVVNIGVGEAASDSKKIESATTDLTTITGQKPIITKAKKSIAGFKLRKGVNIGCKVTLRKDRMYEFLDRLITIAMPRIRDFRGVSSKSFDGRGNYALGIKEHIVFPEIDFDKIDEPWGLDIVIATTANTDAEAKALLTYFNMPFNS